MPHISAKNLSVEFSIPGSNARSLRMTAISHATGGRLARAKDDSVSVKALVDVSLEIASGDRIGLAGHNGAGKTTLLRVVAGIYHPTAGRVSVSGTVGALLSPQGGMDPDLSGIENIYLKGRLLGLSKTEIDVLAEEVADFTDLGQFISLPLRTYSAGMVARLAFAISTAIKPSILLIDEGIGAGDAGFKDKVKARVDAFVARSQIVVLASHDVSLMERLCNRIVRLEHGRVTSDERR